MYGLFNKYDNWYLYFLIFNGAPYYSIFCCFRRRIKLARRKIDFEGDEERRIKEGAETLLKLAGIATYKRCELNRCTENLRMHCVIVQSPNNEVC